MIDRTVFSVAHLLGVLPGIASGLLLPWWLSGAPAWAAMAGAFAWYLHRPDDLRSSQAAGFGAFWGVMAGAIAVDADEILDALLWPGHDDHGYGIIIALLASLAWGIGDLVSPDDDDGINPRPRKPGRVGLVLYLIVAALTLGPGVWEVL